MLSRHGLYYTVALIAVATSLATRVVAQNNNTSCTGEDVGQVGDFLQDFARGHAVAQALSQPLTSPDSKQVAAPASADSSTLVNGAAFPQLVGLAFENSTGDVSNGVTTLNLNLFGFKTILFPQIVDTQSLYEQQSNERLRQFGGSVSFGGKGDSFDRNGDGVPDPALMAKNPDDIVKWELRYRVLGSRDRRDRGNVAKLLNDPDVKELFNREAASFARLNKTIADHLENFRSSKHPQCLDRAKLQKELTGGDYADELRKFTDAWKELSDKIDTVNKKIDQSTIWTFVLGGLDRRKQFGPSQRTASLRGAKGSDDKGFTWNLDYTRTEGMLASLAPTWKLGLDYSELVGKGHFTKDGAKLSLSGDYELNNQVRMATHDTIAKLNAKIEFPVTTGVSLPISVTWANHRDLLTAEHDVRGHIGFTVDFSKLTEKAQQAK